jgi:chitinase
MDKAVLNRAADMSAFVITKVGRVSGSVGNLSAVSGWLKQQLTQFAGRTKRNAFLTCIAFGVCVCSASAANQTPSIVKLAWNPSPDPSVVGYRIYYGVAPAQYTNSITLANVTSGEVAGLVNGVTYYFAVAAYAAGGAQSPFSNEIRYQVAYSQLQLRTTPARQVVLTIGGQVGHTYAVEATQDFVTWMVIGTATPGAGGVEFTDANAASFAKRYYRLRDTTP